MLKVVLIMLFTFSTPLTCYLFYIFPVFLEHADGSCISKELAESYHTDYVRGLRWIKWKYTVVCGVEPPTQDWGNQHSHPPGLEAPKPIPPPGELQKSHTIAHNKKFWDVRMDYAAKTIKLGRYTARIGWRWDDLGNFYVLSFTIKKIPYYWNRLLFWEIYGNQC